MDLNRRASLPELLLTYRNGLRVPLPDGSTLESDAGWSCTLRSTQTLVANALVRADAAKYTVTSSLRLCFEDNSGVLGLGALLHGSSGGEVRRWRGPGEAAHLMQRAGLRAEINQLPFVIVAQADATIVEREVFTSATRLALILLPLRLNESARLSESSTAGLCAACAIPFFVGAVAGTHGRSLTIVGFSARETFLALDPHREQAAETASLVALEADRVIVSATDLDPSLSLGFLVRPCDFSLFRSCLQRALPVSFPAIRAASAATSDLLADSPVSGEWTDAAADVDDIEEGPLSPPPSPDVADFLHHLARHTAAGASRVWQQMMSAWRAVVRSTAHTTASRRVHGD